MAAVRPHPDMGLWNDQSLDINAPDTMEHVYLSFLDYAGDISSHNKIAVFLARSSSGQREEKNDFLRSSLRYTQEAYEDHYGPLPCQNSDVRLYTFVHGSNDPFRPGGETRTYCANLRAELNNRNASLLLIANGWDGLTTNQHSFFEIFEGWGEKIAYRIYADDTPCGDRLFFEASIEQTCQLINGDRLLESVDSDSEYSLEHSTARYFRMMCGISDWKAFMGFDHNEMHALTDRRNTPKEMRSQFKYECDECKMLLRTSRDLCIHKNHRHKVYIDPDANLTCPGCNECFKRKDYRDRHSKKCRMNSDADGSLLGDSSSASTDSNLSQQKRKRAKRGTRLRVPLPEDQPQGSDNGLLTYRQLQSEHAINLPRLKVDLEERCNSEVDLIYKGELFCRYPGCQSVVRYSEPTKLRVHYGRVHQFTYQQSSYGKLNPVDQEMQEGGLAWLAKCCQLGMGSAGQKPRCLRK
ncbi:hypothetical protein MYU51_019253 [Penicillium brevicompactum]|uniref:uncharacterized protein n=1 Tax=Penicillium brevicompactum TaxID=5074 RepID=UPI0025422065|nr:uncharacterized protein N7506_006203 [Penicillium brevicompactum]KAJ5332420.1 hypothetical protein N7506_006203 [Penicillium brevicompactum]